MVRYEKCPVCSSDARQIGNSVSVPVIKQIAQQIGAVIHST